MLGNGRQTNRQGLGPELVRLIELLAKLPGLGPKSARRAALALLKKRENLMAPLADAMRDAANAVKTCKTCGNLDTLNPCSICQNDVRDKTILCVVAEVADLWAFERAGGFRGQYHVLGGLLSPLDGIRPEDLRINSIIERIEEKNIKEIVFALSATVDGQSTAHYLAQILEDKGVKLSRLAHGLPVGGELDHLDEGTLMTALRARLVV